MSLKRGLQAKLVQTVDECGKTPPLPGVMNSSGDPLAVRCSQGYIATSIVKPLRP